MARAIGQIKRELAVLEENVATLAIELRSLYGKYLDLLSKSVRKQLVLATYQICTHVYPESFLRLSFNQREKLQASIRQLGKEIHPQLFSYLDNPSGIFNNSNFMEQMLTQLSGYQESEKLGTVQQELPLPLQPEGVSANLPDETELGSLESIQSIEEPPFSMTNPNDSIQWQLQVEHGIHQTLENLSLEANRYLQQGKVLPDRLPAKLMERAMRAEESDSSISSPPNLLTLLIETDNDGQSEDSEIAKIIAIRLRLSEIEFSEPTLTAQRSQIRSLATQISQIQQQYQKKQRECAVAEAEAAWRSSWFED